MRQLASIKEVSALYPIEGKDRIELAQIDGWRVIVKKGEFNVGSKCVYVEIDSVLPEIEQFEFLRNKNFRIKTLKMAGVVSQGICFPLDILPKKNYNIGEDVTDVLGIKQYEPTMDTERDAGDKKAVSPKYPKWLMRFKWFRQIAYKRNHREGKGFPSFISKTDETRIQNMPFILSDKRPFIVTEKVDGQSGTWALVKKNGLFKPKYEYIVCSRNIRLYNKDNSSYWHVSEKYNIKNKLKEMIGDNEWIAIQGECVASNVQGNKYKVKEPDMYAFNVILPQGRMGSVEAAAFVTKHGMKFVPILDTEYVLPDTVNEMLDYAHSKSAIGDTLREGVVVRSRDGKTSFKIVDPLFLLKYDE
jgi:hypothetical protein